MHKAIRIFIAMMTGLLVGPQATWAESAAAGGEVTSPQHPVPAGQTSAQTVLRPYYVLPFFPFLWPLPPDHPAAMHPQAQTSQPPTPHPSYPFVLWLPFRLPGLPPAPVELPVPAAARPGASQAATGSALVSVQTPSPQVQASEARPSVPEGVGAQSAPEVPAQAPSSVSKEAKESAQPTTELATVAQRPQQEPKGTRPVPTTKPGLARPLAVKPVPRGVAAKRRLCWKDGKLDVCK